MKMSVSSLDLMGLIKLHRSDLSLEPLHFSMKKLGFKGWVWDMDFNLSGGHGDKSGHQKKASWVQSGRLEINQSINQSIFNSPFTIFTIDLESTKYNK